MSRAKQGTEGNYAEFGERDFFNRIRLDSAIGTASTLS